LTHVTELVMDVYEEKKFTKKKAMTIAKSLGVEQKRALELARKGHNLFITGGAGTGKTFILKEIIRELEDKGKHVAVTASTGVATVNLGGCTIHSYLGCNDETNWEQLQESNKAKTEAQRKNECKRFRETEVIVLDEISMICGDEFDMVNKHLCNRLKRSNAFAGKQVILCGDFLQLPPVVREGEKQPEALFAFQSSCWQELHLEIINLKKIYRQTNERFHKALNDIRMGRFREKYVRLFDECAEPKGRALKHVPTQLYPTRKQVDQLNLEKLDNSPNQIYRYQGQWAPKKMKQENWQKKYGQFFIADSLLKLKKGALVLVIADLDTEAGVVNGTQAIVTEATTERIGIKITGGPAKNRRLTLAVGSEEQSWELKTPDGAKIRAGIKQLPLKLAFALTVHESQGMSLDTVHVALSQNFSPGQVYVALSRARTPEGLSLDRILQRSDIDVEEACVKFYEELK